MNGPNTAASQNASVRQPKPPPPGPAPPAPLIAPPVPPNQSSTSPLPSPATRSNPSAHHHHAPGVNGHHSQTTKGKKRNDTPIDPATMYESLKNRIAALEEEEVLEEEEERRFGTSLCHRISQSFAIEHHWSRRGAEVCQRNGGKCYPCKVHWVGMVLTQTGSSSLLIKYMQFAEFKRLERDHAKEKQKLVKDKDAGTFNY